MTFDIQATRRAHILAQPSMPEHVAMIMDGNGRWAQEKGRPRAWGHSRGAKNVKGMVTLAGELRIKALTLYAFSEENWGRPQEEISSLMGLLNTYLLKEKAHLHENNVRFQTIGSIHKLPPSSRALIADTQKDLSANTGLTLTIALSYGARSELSEACRHIAEKVRSGAMSVDDITPHVISSHLQTMGVPDPDLLIRTGGEQRVSNFLLWQLAYTELYFSPKYWPDFQEADFLDGIEFYQSRSRRFGRIDPSTQPDQRAFI